MGEEDRWEKTGGKVPVTVENCLVFVFLELDVYVVTTLKVLPLWFILGHQRTVLLGRTRGQIGLFQKAIDTATPHAMV